MYFSGLGGGGGGGRLNFWLSILWSVTVSMLQSNQHHQNKYSRFVLGVIRHTCARTHTLTQTHICTHTHTRRGFLGTFYRWAFCDNRTFQYTVCVIMSVTCCRQGPISEVNCLAVIGFEQICRWPVIFLVEQLSKINVNNSKDTFLTLFLAVVFVCMFMFSTLQMVKSFLQ